MINKILKRSSRFNFVLQIDALFFKLIKYEISNHNKIEINAIEETAIDTQADFKSELALLAPLFKRLGYKFEPLVVSLPRSLVTCRYLKVPSQSLQEIERIAGLQASRFLPYPAEELVTGFQILKTDNQGYAEINLVIAHKSAISRYEAILNAFKPSRFAIFLSSLGLNSVYASCFPEEVISQQPVLLADIDHSQVELAIVDGKTNLFSRTFKASQTGPGLSQLLSQEIEKTREVYAKETGGVLFKDIFILGDSNLAGECEEFLKNEARYGVQKLDYMRILGFSDPLIAQLSSAKGSFASLIGLSLMQQPDSMSLLPRGIKERGRQKSTRLRRIRLASFILATVIIWWLGLVKNYDNKNRYLTRLNGELNRLAKEARPLEQTEKRIKALKDKSRESLISLDLLYAVIRAMPERVSLASYSYEENGALLIRGQSPDLNSVFSFASALSADKKLRSFIVKVRYATKKQSASGEMIDFEIACSRK